MRRWIAGALALALVVGGVLWWWLGSRGLGKDDALEVGDHTVTIADLQSREHALTALYGVQEPTDPTKLDQFWRDLAKSVVMGYVIDDEAAADGVAVSEAVAQSTLSDYITQHYGPGQDGTDAFDRALGDAGASRQQVLDEITRQLEISKMFDHVTGGTSVPTDAEVRAAYRQRRCQIDRGPRRTIDNIAVAQRQTAVRAYRELSGGAPFAQVARRLSEDSSTASKGGHLGTFDRSQLEASYARVAFAAPVGKVFGPVHTQQGWNVGVVTAVVPAGHLAFSQVRGQLRSLLLTERRSAAWQTWLGQALHDAHAEYADKYRPADPYAPPSNIADQDTTGQCSR